MPVKCSTTEGRREVNLQTHSCNKRVFCNVIILCIKYVSNLLCTHSSAVVDDNQTFDQDKNLLINISRFNTRVLKWVKHSKTKRGKVTGILLGVLEVKKCKTSRKN